MNPNGEKRTFVVFLLLISALTAATPVLRSEMPGTDAGAPLSLSSLSVPEELGKVRERFKGTSGRTILQIQDVHAHAVAQQNIAAILERLRTVFGIDKAALEGAWSSTSLPKSHAIPTSREKRLLATTLLEDDLISGPVYAAIMSPGSIMLTGIEDAALYEQNRKLYLEHLSMMPEVSGKTGAYGEKLRSLQQASWNPALLSFANAFGEFRKTSDLEKFFPTLLKTAEAQGAKTLDLTQIALMQDIMAIEKTFDKERLEQEVKQLMRQYRSTPATLEELIRGGWVPAEKLGLYPEIQKLNRLYSMRDGISLEALTTQIDTLTGRVLETLVTTSEEQALWDKTERFYLARRLLLLQATPEDLRSYENEKSLLGPELAEAGLSEPLVLSVEFYETVKARDEIFFHKVMNDPFLAGDIAIITGGFHTDGLSQKFRNAGVSYITITPDLGGEAMNENLYNERMAAPHKDRVFAETPQRPGLNGVENQTLSELRNVIEDADERFVYANQVRSETRDLRKAVAAFRREIPQGGNFSIRGSPRRTAFFSVPAAAQRAAFNRESFLAMSRREQLATLEKTLSEPGKSGRRRTVVVARASVLKDLIERENAGPFVRDLVERDFLAAAVDLSDPSEIPEEILGSTNVKRYDRAAGVAEVLASRDFRRLTGKTPPVVIDSVYQDERKRLLVLEATVLSLKLYRLFDPGSWFYVAAARNPEFLNYLTGLMNEIQAQELPARSA